MRNPNPGTGRLERGHAGAYYPDHCAPVGHSEEGQPYHRPEPGTHRRNRRAGRFTQTEWAVCPACELAIRYSIRQSSRGKE
jgi:hypothetical protein